MTDETQVGEAVEAPPVQQGDSIEVPSDGTPSETVELANPQAIPEGLDRDGILDWVDAGARERAELVLAAQNELAPEKRDARLVVDLTAWLAGGTVDQPVEVRAESVKLASTSAREQEMYEAEALAWQRENPGAPLLEVEAAYPADDEGVGA